MLLATLTLIAIGCADGTKSTRDDAAAAPAQLRVASFNASLYRQDAGQLAEDLSGGEDAQARDVAAVLQRVRPDVVLVNEFDWDADGTSAQLFREEYLAVAQGDQEPIEYPYIYVADTNTGLHSGVDLNQDGRAVSEPGSQAYGNDAFGYGTFHGQYGMVIYSRYPIAEDEVRTFQSFLWKDMPGNLLPTDFYSDAAADVFRLSSKNHVDVPVEVDGHTVHLLASHPTPPSFDGDEDRNGRRNHDEIRFWLDYVTGGEQAGYIYDDAGGQGGLSGDAAFVVVGDLNSDPKDGDSRRQAIIDLLASARTTDTEPSSAGGEQAAETDGRVNAQHDGNPALDTADFSDTRVGNLRVDYAVPSSNMTVDASGVFWPAPGEPGAELADVSDHHLVWVDVTVGE